MSGDGLHAVVRLERSGLDLAAALRAQSGTTVALLGPNGAGKTSLLLALTGLLRLDGGYVLLDGRVLDDPGGGVAVPPQRRGVGVVFQDLRLFPALDVRDNVAYGLRAHGVGRRAARARGEAMLDALDAAPLARRSVGTLSGGEAQRVALARALVIRPRLLLLDEPLAALDVRARGDIRALLRRALPAYGGPRLLVTHEPVEALALADTIVVLEGGRVVQEGTPEAIRRAPRSPFVASLADVNVMRGRIRRAAGQTCVAGAQGSLVVADPPAGQRLPAGSEALVVWTPAAVMLHDARPPHGSARNVVEATVVDVELAGGRARVRLDGRPPMVAEVTPAAAADLRLAPGVRVWASLKATELRLEGL